MLLKLSNKVEKESIMPDSLYEDSITTKYKPDKGKTKNKCIDQSP
jgi:hypothetical protein